MEDLLSDDSLRYKHAFLAYSAEIVQEILKHVAELHSCMGLWCRVRVVYPVINATF